MSTTLPWDAPDWTPRQTRAMDAALLAAGRPRSGPVEEVKRWGRACLWRVPVADDRLWAKHGYRLPPGEEQVLARLHLRWADRLPALVATWDGGMALETMPGHELTEEDPLARWTEAAHALGELQAGEAEHAEAWLRLGLRDRRPPAFAKAVEALLEGRVLQGMSEASQQAFAELARRQAEAYADAYVGPTTLVPQDSGCCNIHVTDAGPVLYDWADVVVGHPAFSLDRLLDQVPAERQEAVIEAFRAPLGLDAAEIRALRKAANVLHEILRYHDELAWIPEGDPAHDALARAVRGQVDALLRHHGLL